MTQKVSVTLYGMEGHGKNLTEAKADAGRKAEAALSGDYSPVFIKHGDTMALVTRDPQHGWGYSLIHPAEEKPSRVLYPITVGAPEHSDRAKKDVISYATFHLAQNAGHYAGLEQMMSEAKRRELDSYFHQQAIYRAAKDRGLSDEAARQEASNTPLPTTVTEAAKVRP